jgi:hypothetical protein
LVLQSSKRVSTQEKEGAVVEEVELRTLPSQGVVKVSAR